MKRIARRLNTRSQNWHSVEKEKRFRRKDSTVIWTTLSTFRIREPGPNSAFYPAIIVDITERKRAEEALRESELELARVSRLTRMGQLAASIALELKQPLTAAITNGTTCQHWLSEGVLDLAKARSAAQRMIVAARRASEVMDRIHALLDKAPVEPGASLRPRSIRPGRGAGPWTCSTEPGDRARRTYAP